MASCKIAMRSGESFSAHSDKLTELAAEALGAAGGAGAVGAPRLRYAGC